MFSARFIALGRNVPLGDIGGQRFHDDLFGRVQAQRIFPFLYLDDGEFLFPIRVLAAGDNHADYRFDQSGRHYSLPGQSPTGAGCYFVGFARNSTGSALLKMVRV